MGHNPFMLISSLQNSRIKNVVRLNKRRQRDAQRRTFVEGLRECARALDAGVVPYEAYICDQLMQGSAAADVLRKLQGLSKSTSMDLFEVTAPVFAKMAYRSESGGVLLVVPYQETTLKAMLGHEQPFLAVIDGAEKPGNLGAILRTADAAGVDGLILSENREGGTDVHNPNAIRASLGAYFTVPVAALSCDIAIQGLSDAHIKIVATSPDADDVYSDVDLGGAIAVVMGSEAQGLGDRWLQAADQQVLIPMFGRVDSLNLSVSTALLLYEVLRQRR